MKEIIYNQFTSSDHDLIGWAIAKNWGLDISAKQFHIYCRELISEGDLTRTKVSNNWLYKLWSRR